MTLGNLIISMLFYLNESSNKNNNKKKINSLPERFWQQKKVLQVFGYWFFKCVVTDSLKQLVKNIDMREKNGLEKKQPTWKSNNKKRNINSLPAKIGFFKCLVTG
jgi:hypothetical protein